MEVFMGQVSFGEYRHVAAGLAAQFNLMGGLVMYTSYMPNVSEAMEKIRSLKGPNHGMHLDVGTTLVGHGKAFHGSRQDVILHIAEYVDQVCIFQDAESKLMQEKLIGWQLHDCICVQTYKADEDEVKKSYMAPPAFQLVKLIHKFVIGEILPLSDTAKKILDGAGKINELYEYLSYKNPFSDIHNGKTPNITKIYGNNSSNIGKDLPDIIWLTDTVSGVDMAIALVEYYNSDISRESVFGLNFSFMKTIGGAKKKMMIAEGPKLTGKCLGEE
jgi:hypothetical protein